MLLQISEIEQQARRFQRRGAEHDYLRSNLFDLARNAIDVHHAGSFSVLHGNAGGDSVGEQSQAAGLQGIGDGSAGAREIRRGDAALFAWSAIVAGGATVVLLGENGDAADGDGAPHFFLDAIAQDGLAAGHVHRRKENRIGKLRQAFGLAADADVALDFFVIGHHFVVGDRPIVAVAVMRSGFEIEIAHAIRLASPGKAASAEHAQANPMERLFLRVGVFEIVDELLMIGFAAGVAEALDGPFMRHHGRESEILHLPGLHVLGVILARDFGAGFEQGDVPAGLGQVFRGPASSSAGADDDGVERIFGSRDL